MNIASSDPFEPPLIDLGFLTSEFDVLALVDSVQMSQRFVSAPNWRGYLGAPVDDISALNATALVEYFRNNVGSAFHLVGTASMSPLGAQWGS